MTTGSSPARGRAVAASSAAYVLPLIALFALVGALAITGAKRAHSAAPVSEESEGRSGIAEVETRVGTGVGTNVEVAEPEPMRWVDPAEATVRETPAWADPRWLEHVHAVLAAHEPFALEGPEARADALRPLAAELAALSFVERVERLAATPAGGLELELLLRKPVACIPTRGEFALVDADGVVLEGRWPLPPRLGHAYLPVLGPLDDALFARARTGDWLVEPEHLDALDVALSLEENLGDAERAGLGRIVIDARRARATALDEPGIRLELEGARLALFGRSPHTTEPGELPAVAKWRGLARAFDWFAQDPAANDWTLVDLRWDRPDLAPRSATTIAALDSRAPRAGRAPERATRAVRSGPHVR
jgi:hypothetical protein